MIDLKSESHSLATQNRSRADSSNGIANRTLFASGAAQAEPHSDGINEILNDDQMEFECVSISKINAFDSNFIWYIDDSVEIFTG